MIKKSSWLPERLFLFFLDFPAREKRMNNFLLWLILLVICWPLALLALLLYPLLWLLLLPFRLLGIAVGGVFKLLETIIMLPVRILRGHRA